MHQYERLTKRIEQLEKEIDDLHKEIDELKKKQAPQTIIKEDPLIKPYKPPYTITSGPFKSYLKGGCTSNCETKWS